jgi:DNA repair protein RecO (recombination protein O)
MGESNKILTLFSPDQGIYEATMYGGPKSKLKSLASPFHSGTAYLYLDPIRDSYKLKDFDVAETWPSLRESIEKTWTASLWAELMIKTHATGGGYLEQFALLLEAFSALEACQPSEAAYPSMVFLWKSISRMGLKPDFRHCEECGGAIGENDVPWFDELRDGFLCGNCGASGNPGAFKPFRGVLRFMESMEKLKFREAARIRLEPSSLAMLKSLVHGLARKAAEGELKTLSSGEGIL